MKGGNPFAMEKSSEPAIEVEGEEEGPALSDMAGMRAAKALVSALESGNAKAVDKALRDHYEACSE